MTQFDPAIVGSLFTFEYFTISPGPGFSPLKLCPPNANRVNLIVSGTIAYDIRIGAGNQTKTGIIVPPNSSPVIFEFNRWGGVLNNEFWINNNGAAGVIVGYGVNYYPVE